MILFLKSHIDAYTKKDGTFVAAHEDKRAAAKDGKEGHLWAHGPDLERSILAHIEADPDATWGLRVIPDGYEVSVGDELEPSKHWDDGTETDEELDGTSTIGIDNEDEIAWAIKKLHENGYYGTQIALVFGDSSGWGDDPGERLISDAKVAAVWRRPNASARHPDNLIKAHVSTYTKRDGTFVAAHDDKRTKQQPGGQTAEHHRQHDLFEEQPPVYSVSAENPKADVPEGLDLGSYDTVLIGFSGGKDSIACVLALLERGVPPEKIELHHHDIDGDGATFMDWPITKDYCRKFAGALGMKIYFSWRDGGFEREMMRDNQRTASVLFEKPDGTVGRSGGEKGPLGTRRKFPQQSASLTTRWCSGALKVDVMASAVRNQDRFKGKRTLIVTGERAEESANRAKYKTFAPDRSHSQSRHVDHYMPVHGWDEQKVWDTIRRHGIVPHPAYQLGYGRLSCRHCIFAGKNQIATNHKLYPESTGQIIAREREFGVTIHRTEDVETRAKKGTPYQAAVDQPEVAKLGDSREWVGPIIVPPDQWKLPAGAFGEKDGPC